MSMIRVRIGEGEQPQVNYLWDTQWHPREGAGDWVLAGPAEPMNRGGLQARGALHTAVILLLFTDKRIPNDHPLMKLVDDGDQRGWWGDGVDVRSDRGETDMGSLLWVFERAYLNEDIRRWVEAIALDALSPLVAQGAVVRVECQATRRPPPGDGVNLAVQMYGRDGSRIYDTQFEDIWKQTATTPKSPTF